MISQNQYDAWYSAWLTRINGWTMDCGVGPTADVILLIPELVMLLLSLSANRQIPPSVTAKLKAIASNTMRGIDFLPEDGSAVIALVGDAIKMARELEPLLPELDTALINQHWQNQRSLAETVAFLLRETESLYPRC